MLLVDFILGLLLLLEVVSLWVGVGWMVIGRLMLLLLLLLVLMLRLRLLEVVGVLGMVEGLALPNAAVDHASEMHCNEMVMMMIKRNSTQVRSRVTCVLVIEKGGEEE